MVKWIEQHCEYRFKQGWLCGKDVGREDGDLPTGVWVELCKGEEGQSGCERVGS